MRWPASLGKYVPGPLAALIIGTVAGLFMSVPVLGEIPTGLPSLHMPVLESDTLFLVIEAAVILAVLGAIDSLLTSLVADNMTRTRHDSSRELVGQGIGNMMAGFIGGIAGAGATMRTVVNIRAGGQQRISGMVHSLLLLAVVLGLSPLAAQIPHAVLAGILVKVGLDIIDWSYLKKAHRGPRWDLLLMALVLGMTVFVDLITAVSTGVVLAALAYVRQVGQAQLQAIKQLPDHLDDPEERALLHEAGGGIQVFDFGGPLSFSAAADLGHKVRETVEPGTVVLILDFSRVPFTDVSAARAVETVVADAERAGKAVYVAGLRGEVKQTLEALNALVGVPQAHSFETRLEALRAATLRLQDVSAVELKSCSHGAVGKSAQPFVS